MSAAHTVQLTLLRRNSVNVFSQHMPEPMESSPLAEKKLLSKLLTMSLKSGLGQWATLIPVTLNLIRTTVFTEHCVPAIVPATPSNALPNSLIMYKASFHNYLKMKTSHYRRCIFKQFNICTDSSCMRNVRLRFMVCYEEPVAAVAPPRLEVSYVSL